MNLHDTRLNVLHCFTVHAFESYVRSTARQVRYVSAASVGYVVKDCPLSWFPARRKGCGPPLARGESTRAAAAACAG